MRFHVGQKVVKIPSTSVAIGPRRMPVLVNGQVYTIREIDTRAIAIHGMATIRLDEIIGPITTHLSVGEWELGYRPSSFRPIIENKSSISFTMGADPESERWDNRVKVPAKA